MSETITVRDMGEDGDQWLVTGTTDAHSADEAIRQHVENVTGETIEALLDAEDLVEFTFHENHWWAWGNLDADGNPWERSLLYPAADVCDGHEAFHGYLVSA